MSCVVRGAEGLIIKNGPTVLMTVKGTKIVCISLGRATQVEQYSFITTSAKITQNHTSIPRVSFCVMGYLILFSLVYLPYCFVILF